jgi:hypothetical protein
LGVALETFANRTLAMSLQGCIHSVSQEIYPTAGESTQQSTDGFRGSVQIAPTLVPESIREQVPSFRNTP